MEQIKVKKRNGRLVNGDFAKIQTRIKRASRGLKVNPMEIAMKVIQGLYDGVTTVELDKLSADTAASYAINHPDYSKLASKIAITSLHKDTTGDFEKVFTLLKNNNSINQDYIDTVKSYGFTKIKKAIDYERDFELDYFGYKTLEKSYLIKIKKEPIERPQDMYMRVAITVTENIEDAIETYNILSGWGYTHATPTLFNAGLKNQQLASCFLINNKGDNKEDLFDTIKDVGIISSGAGGIGISASNVRGKGSRIHSTNGTSHGLMPYLRTLNQVALWMDQGGGKRKGSFAIYLEPWHIDIFTLLDIRKTHGKEELRARDLFPALWMNDLFMEQLEVDGDWYLSCPNEQQKAGFTRLDEVHSEEFKVEYDKIVEAIKNKKIPGKKIKALELWESILTSQMETGTPYMLYKDAANNKSNQKNLGTIKSSNLCTEIIEYSSPEEQAVCNLASINLVKCIKNGKFDFSKLDKITQIATKNLNTVIDKNHYPTVETELSNLRHRPIGLGVQGLADVFVILKLPFTSEKAKSLNSQIFEQIYYSALKSSCELAKKDGPYSSYEGSPVSQGILQYDMWGVEPIMVEEWRKLKEEIKKYGIRNSLLVAPMPTASTAQIMGNNEAFEPFKSNIYVRRVLSGEFIIINKHLIKDLEELDMWNEDVKYNIIQNNGSVQFIDGLPQEIKDLYKTTWEMSMKDIIDMAADRGAFIDQSQSMNLWLADPTLGKLSSMHTYSWKKGLKTGMYYLRTKAAVKALSSLGVEKQEQPQVQQIQSEEEFECIGCGS